MRKQFLPKSLSAHNNLSLHEHLNSHGQLEHLELNSQLDLNRQLDFNKQLDVNRQLDLKHPDTIQLAWVFLRPCLNVLIMGALILMLAAHCSEQKTLSVSDDAANLPQSPASALDVQPSRQQAPSVKSTKPPSTKPKALPHVGH